MEIIVKQMLLNNFKGCLGVRTIKFASKLTEIFGANKTGKTTIADAFRWCLFGKNSEGAATFGIKTKDAAGKVIPNLAHIVEIELEVDGTEVVLHRELTEKWSKPVGSKEKVLTGHTTSYFVNGNKYTEKDYKAYIDELCNEQMFLSITNPAYFVSLKPDQQRALLTKMVGEVSKEDVAAGSEDFQWLLKEMGNEELESFMQHVSYQKKQINEELERIPIRINEQQQDIASMQQDSDWAQLEAELQATEAAIQRIDDEIADRSKMVDSQYQALVAKRNDINALKLQVADAEGEHTKAYNKEVRDEQGKEADLHNAIDDAQRAVNRAQQEIDYNEQYLAQDAKRAAERAATWEQRKTDFRTRWAAASKEQFEADENSTEFECPTCHRRYEAEDIAKAIEDMRISWNTEHAERMRKLTSEAQLMKDEMATEEQRMELNRAQYKQGAEKASKELREATDKLNAAKLALDKHQAATIQPVDERIANDMRITNIKAAIKQQEAELARMQEQPTDAEDATSTTSLKADKAQLQQKRDEQKILLNNRELIKGKQARITELEQQEGKLNEQLTELEHKEYTAQQLMEATITELEERVNKLFTIVRFEMFDHKLNGSLKPTCECSVGGVPYSDLNNADRINAGIDIINAICKYNGIYAPCFIDNAESINKVLPMQSQQVLLRVSEDKELVINHK